ncbi:restriction endonuclease [Prevotella sp. 10(H)]|uniref:restriction endonuclease n=1 Tax=Prevotella sp. 10(H) TaxID=1158294 RepID=UPI0004A6FF4B|nr:restriction endonuclease [Prevotella sp. 10(H)]
MSETNIPFGSEFSPSQTELTQLLSFCKEYSGNKKLIESNILEKYFKEHGNGNLNNQKKLAMNCRLGLKAYGIIDENSVITPLGEQLYMLTEDENELYRVFGKHILLNLNGMAFVQCIRDMTVASEEVNLTTLRAALAERGLYYPSGGKHPSIMRLWLNKAGIFRKNWQIDNQKVNEVLGVDDSIEALRDLTTLQRAFLLSLMNTGISTPQYANQIARLAETTYGVKFPEKSLPKEVLNGLEKAGFIITSKTTEGRGAKPFLVVPTEKANKEIVEPLILQLKGQNDPKLISLLTKSVSEILNEIDSNDRYISGLALEALAFKLMRIIGMNYVATRLRAETTGGSEVDLIFDSTRLVYSRWQIQCKNTKRVALDDVAKEVGLTHFLKSNVIVIVSTGDIGKDARKYSNKIMKDSNLCIVLIDGEDIKKVSQNPVAIIDAFEREAKETMELKKIEL